MSVRLYLLQTFIEHPLCILGECQAILDIVIGTHSPWLSMRSVHNVTMTLAELFDRHVSLVLSQYAGNLLFLDRILEAGEMPNLTDPTNLGWAKDLRQFLSTHGVPEADDFLLRVGLAVPGAYRGIHPAIAALSPERGGFSQRRLKQAADQVARLREALTLGYQFFPDMSADTAAALHELSERTRPPVIPDEEWVGMHAMLSPSDVGELASRAFQCLDSDAKNVREVGISLLQMLADCRRDGLGAATRQLARRRIFYPGSLYRGAPDDVAELVIQQIGNANSLQINHLLLALAWTRGERARDAFLEWRTRPPGWTAQLHVPVENYTDAAGWTSAEQGARRDLIDLSCYRIAKRLTKNESGFTISCRSPAGSKCPGCGGDLSWLFDFSALPQQFFSGERERAPRKVVCCLRCACFSPIFSRYKADGIAEWHPATASAEVDPTGTWPSCECQISPDPFPPFAAANPFQLDDPSSLGGIPMWLQDSEYPHCPDCAQSMRFLAQFCNLTLPTPEEGIYYAFYCPFCQVAAVTYQQT